MARLSSIPPRLSFKSPLQRQRFSGNEASQASGLSATSDEFGNSDKTTSINKAELRQYYKTLVRLPWYKRFTSFFSAHHLKDGLHQAKQEFKTCFQNKSTNARILETLGLMGDALLAMVTVGLSVVCDMHFPVTALSKTLTAFYTEVHQSAIRTKIKDALKKGLLKEDIVEHEVNMHDLKRHILKQAETQNVEDVRKLHQLIKQVKKSDN